MSIVTIARGDGSRIDAPHQAVARDEMEWRAVWAAHAGPELPPPAVDFGSRMVVAAFAGERPTPGFEIEITRTDRLGVALAVVVEERRPPASAVTAQMIVTPFHIVTVPRYDGDVRFVGPGELPGPGRAVAVSAADAPSTTGLPPHVAAALSYLAGPFSGATILAAERTNTFVRFHAWQAIVGLGGLALFALLLLAGAFLALFISPTAFTVLYRLSAIVAIAWLGVWLVCLYAAYTGKRLELPLVGPFAVRKAAVHH